MISTSGSVYKGGDRAMNLRRRILEFTTPVYLRIGYQILVSWNFFKPLFLRWQSVPLSASLRALFSFMLQDPKDRMPIDALKCCSAVSGTCPDGTAGTPCCGVGVEPISHSTDSRLQYLLLQLRWWVSQTPLRAFSSTWFRVSNVSVCWSMLFNWQ